MSEIKPALTAEEWNSLLRLMWATASENEMDINDHVASVANDKGARAAAAVALNGIGYLTWEDVDLLRSRASEGPRNWILPAEAKRLRSLADRIAALLPPREES